jgi:hypothetical protein
MHTSVRLFFRIRSCSAAAADIHDFDRARWRTRHRSPEHAGPQSARIPASPCPALSCVEMALKLAHFPAVKELAGFDFEAHDRS